MSSSLSSLVDNLSDGFDCDKCIDCKSYRDYMITKDYQLYSYLKDDDSNDKKAEGTKKYIIKRTVTFNDYKDCLFMDEIILKLQQRFKSETHNESKMLSKFKWLILIIMQMKTRQNIIKSDHIFQIVYTKY